jgi:hypothetical protein
VRIDRERGLSGCRRRGEDGMTTFTVYSVDKVRERRVQVGTVVERRRTDRGNNIAGLLKLAANRFKLSPGQKIQVQFGGILVEI